MASPAVLTSLLLLGIIGLFGTIVSVVLMVVLRQSSIVRTSKKHPTPYTPSNPSYHTTLNLIFNGDFEWGRQQGFVPDDHISAVKDFGLKAPDNPPIFTVNPLREYPFDQPGHGHLTTDAKEFVMSLGTNVLGHIHNTAIDNPFFSCSNSDSCEIKNFVITTEDNSNTAQAQALAGASGPYGVVSSVDGLRLYVGYVSPNPDPTNDATFAYNKQVSRVRIFTRDPTSISDTVSPESSTNTQWSASSQFFISNPGGSHVIDDEIRPYVIPGAKHDQFGGVMSCTRNINSGNRWLAVRAQVATTPEEGAMIFLFEEDSIKGQILRFRLQANVAAIEPFLAVSSMPNFGFTDGNVVKTVRWEALSQNFGEALAFGNDMLLVSLHTGVLLTSDNANTPRIKQGIQSVVLWFQKSDSKDPSVDSFIMGGAIPAQLPGVEHFGASVAVDYTGRLALIGAPTLATASAAGSGGNIYAFRFDETKRAWTKTDTWTAPAADPRSFGYWMAVDPFFSAVAVSGKHDNRDSVVPSQSTQGLVNQPDPNQPCVYVVAIDRSTLTLKKDKVGILNFLYYPTDLKGTSLPYWIDPSFRPTSLHVLKTSDSTGTIYRVQVITSSVLNGRCGVYTCKAQSL